MFRELVDQTPDVVFVMRAEDLRTSYVNVAYERVFGRARADLARAPLGWLESVQADERERVRARLLTRRPGARPEALGNFPIVDAQGRARWLHGDVRPLESKQSGRPVHYWVETLRDVTEPRAARAREVHDRQLADRLVDMLGALVVETDAAGRIVWWNDAVTASSGRPLESARGGYILDLVAPDRQDQSRIAEALAAMRGTGRYHVGVRRLEGLTGERREIDWWVAPLRDDEGEIHGFLGLGHDMTAERRTLRALHASDRRFEDLLRNLPDVPWLLSLQTGEFEYHGPGFECLWGRPPPAGAGAFAELEGWVHADDREAMKAAFAEITRGPSGAHCELDYRVVQPDGAIRWLHTRALTVADASGALAHLVGFTMDVTARYETLHALRKSEELLRQMSETTREVFFLVSAGRTRLYYVNPAFEQVFGLSREALYANPRTFLDAIHPDDRERITSIVLHPPSGDVPPVELAYEYRIIRPDGAVRWIHARTFPVVEADGSVERVVGLNADITERKEIERALHERTEQLEQSLREKDVLLAEVHHRVKNNLQAITGLMHLMAAQAHRRPLRETIDELERRIQAMALVHETLYRSTSLAAVDMQAYLERIAQSLASASDSEQRRIVVHVRAPATMDLERAMRCGVIVNELLNNALKHAFTGRTHGRIDVELSCRGEGARALRVSDDGRGLPESLDFESEETLGLRLVAGIAQQIGGTARRVPGERSAIEIVFAADG